MHGYILGDSSVEFVDVSDVYYICSCDGKQAIVLISQTVVRQYMYIAFSLVYFLWLEI